MLRVLDLTADGAEGCRGVDVQARSVSMPLLPNEPSGVAQPLPLTVWLVRSFARTVSGKPVHVERV
jgi:hypothetical protein